MANPNPRLPRDLESRELNARPGYRPPSTLPTPNPEPGFDFRWIASHVLGQAIPANVSMKMREGWVPVKAVDHPELMMEGNESKSGNVEIGGLILCKMASELIKARDEYYLNMAQAQMESVEHNFMRNNDPRMPLFADKKSSSSRGRGFGSGT